MEGVEIQPHIKLSQNDMTPVVLVAGDPARIEKIAKLCDEYKEIAYNREYRTFKCVKNGMTFLAVSHGCGSAGAGICFEELMYLRPKVIIRAGTCGGMVENLKVGEIVLCESAIREDGLSKYLVPLNFPAVTDFDVYNKLKETADEMKIKYKSGVSLTCDAFYKNKYLNDLYQTYADCNALIVEMEASTLFVLGKLRGVKTAALCVVDGCPMQKKHADSYAPESSDMQQSLSDMLNVAINTCVKLTKQFS